MTDTPTPSRDDLAALLPCIWCGSTIVESGKEVSRPYLWHVYCSQCDCSGPTHETEAEAIAAWNRRAPSAPVEVAGLVEGLREDHETMCRLIGTSTATTKTACSEAAAALEASHAASAAKDAEIARLTAERQALAEAICGGEDFPGLLAATAAEYLVDTARKAHQSHSEAIARAERAEAALAEECVNADALADALHHMVNASIHPDQFADEALAAHSKRREV